MSDGPYHTGGNSQLADILAHQKDVQEAIKVVAIIASNAPHQHFSSLIGLVDNSTKQVENWLVHIDVRPIAEEDMEVIAKEMGMDVH